ncbi:MAG: hypothetical protein IT183_14195 [Acidobacteria bacterium]|nr:hypothetical protein [Acidobacteriota bacterium]
MRIAGVTYGVLLAGVLVGGCRAGSPAGPGPAGPTTLTGTWAGAVTESYGGRGRLRLVIEQIQFALSGTFQLEFEDTTRSRGGQLSGNVNLPSLPSRMQLSSSGGFDCAAGQSPQSFVQVVWTQSGDTLKGDYAGFGCVGTVTGTFEVKRE